MKKFISLILLFSLGFFNADAQKKKPNFLFIWGDDIGQSNISAYTKGLVGYQTPNIDRIANEGIIFTDYYAEQSCTAGRSTFITGQSVYRTGLSKVGLPGSDLGLQPEDPTIAEILKPMGYATGQFGKNHLGDKDEMLPTNHGFDEFMGNLYHLNAEEEPELPDYPTNPEFRKKYGPRGVIRSYADGRIEDTGPLTKKRMETVDDETVAAAIAFIKKANASKTPFFVWWNGTRMHFRTHVKESNRGISGQNEYGDGMVEHDMHVGQLLDLLDELGIADETFVMYGTDNGQTLGLMRLYLRSEVKKIQTGKADGECQPWPGGLVISNLALFPMKLCLAWIGFQQL
jgi:arylsulfatase